MQIAQAIRNVFVQLHETLDKLTPEQYTQPSKSLFNATIGQHVRQSSTNLNKEMHNLAGLLAQFRT